MAIFFVFCVYKYCLFFYLYGVDFIIIIYIRFLIIALSFCKYYVAVLCVR